MYYTVRFAHLEKLPDYPIGHQLRRGDIVGEMGNTGQSTGPHLHIDVVYGKWDKIYTQDDIERGDPEAALRQLNYFIDKELFQSDFSITTYIGDYRYMKQFKKVHMGYDIVPVSGKKIYWNRSMPGIVIAKKSHPEGYGNVILVGYEA